jgi:pantothenate kinase-related protein Tda10
LLKKKTLFLVVVSLFLDLVIKGHPDFEYQLKAPFTSAISDSSGCGKSTLIKKLLKRRPSAS